MKTAPSNTASLLHPDLAIPLPEHRIFFQTDELGRIAGCNVLLPSFLGCTEADLLQQPFAGFAEEDEREKAERLLGSALQGQPDTGYIAFPTPSGRRLGQVTVVPMFCDGRPCGLFGFIHDATDRLEKTVRLFETEQKFKALFDGERECVKLLDREARLLEINANGLDLLEAGSAAAVLGKPISDLAHPDDLAAFEALHARVMAGASDELELRICTLQGHERWIAYSSQPLRDRDGAIYAALSISRDITQRKNEAALRREQEEALRISNERYQFVAQATSDVLWDWNLATGELYTNQSFARLLGHEPDAGSNVSELWRAQLHPDDRDRVLEKQRSAICDPDTHFWQDQYRFVKPGGETLHLDDRAIIIRNAEGRALRMTGAAHDVSRQKEVELRLERNERRFRAIVQSGLDVVVLLDRRFTITYISPNAYALGGYTPEELMGVLGFEALYPQDLAPVFLAGQTILQQPQVSLPPFRLRTKSGSLRWIEGTLSNHLADPDIDAVVINLRDVTEKKLAEDEAYRLTLVAERTSNCVVITDARHRITWVNKAFTDLFGYSAGEVIGQLPSVLLIGPETDPASMRYIQDHLERRQPFSCELLNYARSGTAHWMQIEAQPIFDEQGDLLQYFALLTDISERKAIEEAIRFSEERYKLLFYESPMPNWIFRKDDLRFVEVNDAAIGHYGYSRDEFLSMTVLELQPPEERARVERLLRAPGHSATDDVRPVTRHRCSDGSEIFVELTTHGIYLESGYHVMVIVNDVTEKLELERQVLEEKIAVQKEIAKAIINTQEKERSEIGKELHDNVNQLLTTTKLYIENIRYYPEQRDAFVERSAALLQKAISEIRALSKALVTPVIYDIGFRATLEELIEQYRNLNLFELAFHFEAEEDQIENGLRLTIYRILQEQLNNIVKHAGARHVEIRLRRSGALLHICIADDGIGFDPRQKRHGLGLSNMMNRIEVFKGSFNIRSADGEGCEICIRFPV